MVPLGDRDAPAKKNTIAIFMIYSGENIKGRRLHIVNDLPLYDGDSDGKSFLKNQRTPASLAFKRQSSMNSPCGILWKGVLEPLTHVCTDLKISKENNVLIEVMVI